MSSAIAQGRLREERKLWRRDHPIGFWARPLANNDDAAASSSWTWEAGVPGKKGTDWEGGVYKVQMEFSDEYPSRPPKCKTMTRDGATSTSKMWRGHCWPWKQSLSSILYPLLYVSI